MFNLGLAGKHRVLYCTPIIFFTSLLAAYVGGSVNEEEGGYVGGQVGDWMKGWIAGGREGEYYIDP